MENTLEYEVRDFDVDSKTLIIAFSSDPEGKKIEMKRAEWKHVFTNKFKHLDFKKWYIVDINVSWWHTNFPGLLGYGPYVLSRYIKDVIKELDVDIVCTIGLSHGGYGAILIGCLIEADVVIAFSPQTWLTKNRYRKNDLHRKFEGFDIPEEQKDLKLLLENNNSKTIYHIYYGEKIIDKEHAERIKHIRGVNLHPVNIERHGIAKSLVRNGTVEDILYNVIKRNYNFEEQLGG